MNDNVEIERKYIIKMPNIAAMQAECDYCYSDITQIYLMSSPRITHRIRSRKYSDKTVYTETKKVRIDKISSYEDEREISVDEFERLRLARDPESRELRKTRHVFSYNDQIFEIDVYPEWTHTAIMETELPTRDTDVELPQFIEIVREVSGNKSYSNASMSRHFPEEDK